LNSHIAEIQTQMKRLQGEKLELKDCTVALLEDDLQVATKVNLTLRENLKQWEDKAKSLEETIVDFEKYVAEKDSFVSEKESIIKSLEHAVKDYESRVVEKDAHINVIENELQEMNFRMETTKGELQATIKQSQEKDAVIASLNKESQTISMLQQKLTTSEGNLNNCLLQIKDLGKDKNRLVKELNHVQSSSKADVERLQCKLNESIKEIQTLKQVVIEKDAIVSELQVSVVKAEELLKKYWSDIEELVNCKRWLELKLEQCEKELLMTVNDLKESDTKVVKAENTISNLIKDMNNLREVLNEKVAVMAQLEEFIKEKDTNMDEKRLEMLEQVNITKEKDVIITSLEERIFMMETSIEDKDKEFEAKMREVEKLLQKKEELIQNFQMGKSRRSQVIYYEEEDADSTMLEKPPDIETNDDENPISDFHLRC
jgi:chromosome segregation ATPase